MDIATDQESVHEQAEAKVKTFSYAPPDMQDVPRARVNLGGTDLIRGVVQVWKQGGETNLHYHTTTDSLWIVLKGRARFYGPGDSVIGEFGPHEGVVMPRNARYWFESVSEEPMEILQVTAFEEKGAKGTGRTDASPLKQPLGQAPNFQAKTK